MNTGIRFHVDLTNPANRQYVMCYESERKGELPIVRIVAIRIAAVFALSYLSDDEDGGHPDISRLMQWSLINLASTAAQVLGLC